MSISKVIPSRAAGVPRTIPTFWPTGSRISLAGMRRILAGARIQSKTSFGDLTNGELDGVNPKVIVLLAGTNNVGGTYPAGGDDAKVADISKGLKAILDLMRTKAPKAVIIVTGITPRNDGGGTAVMGTINKINANLAAMADGRSIRYLNINNKLADQDGRLFDGMMNASDHLHPTLKGYQVWADALNPVFTELLGPPAKEDHAPPATGDPSAKPPVSAPAAAAR